MAEERDDDRANEEWDALEETDTESDHMRHADGTIIKERASDNGLRTLMYWIMGGMLAVIMLGAGGLIGNIYSRLNLIEVRQSDNRERLTAAEQQLSAVRRDVDQLKRTANAYNARVGAIEKKVFGAARRWPDMEEVP